MSKKIILASNNKGKIKEVSEILSPLGFEVIPQSEAVGAFEAEENGKTFEENAVIKAQAIFDLTKLPVIADDSGLCVGALDGRPGIYSARYAPKGEECEKLLNEMKDVPDGKRGAYFECAIAFIDENGICNVSGKCFGTIAHEMKGTNGFGYDPVFMYEDRTLAQMPAEEKNKISHRAKALEQLYNLLKERECE